jgi:putative peptidoglycan lipid II flippase
VGVGNSSMIQKIFKKETNSITLAAFILAASSVASAILGFLRDRLLAGRFGAGEELDIYYAAFRIPNLIFGLLISGGIIAAFLPIFSEYYKKDKEKAWRLASNVLNVFLLFSILICLILMIFVPYFIQFIVPGFDEKNKAITVTLTRIMFLSPIFFGISNILASILQYFRRFLVYALAPILYNVGIIIGILVFAPLFGLKGLAFGVVLGAFLHWFVQFPSAIGCGFYWKPIFSPFSCGLKRIITLMIPRTISAVASHLNLIIITAIASTIGVGSIAIFNLAEHFRSLPIGIIGGSFAVAAYPFLARLEAEKEREKFIQSLSSTCRQVLFLVVPLSFLLFLLRAQIIRLILGTGKFDWLATRLTAGSLGLFAIGIFAYSLIPLFVRAFFSLQDTKTPLFISIFSLTLNILLAFLFVWLLKFENGFHNFFASLLKLEDIENIRVIGLPLAISISGIVQLSLLLFFLYRKIGNFRLKDIRQSFEKIVLASFVMSFFVYLTLHFIAGFVNMQTGFGVLTQTILAGLIGIFVYCLMAYVLKLSEMKLLFRQFFLIFKKPRPFFTKEEIFIEEEPK